MACKARGFLNVVSVLRVVRVIVVSGRTYRSVFQTLVLHGKRF